MRSEEVSVSIVNLEWKAQESEEMVREEVKIEHAMQPNHLVNMRTIKI